MYMLIFARFVQHLFTCNYILYFSLVHKLHGCTR